MLHRVAESTSPPLFRKLIGSAVATRCAKCKEEERERERDRDAASIAAPHYRYRGSIHRDGGIAPAASLRLRGCSRVIDSRRARAW
jgi:hypothetical protein